LSRVVLISPLSPTIHPLLIEGNVIAFSVVAESRTFAIQENPPLVVERKYRSASAYPTAVFENRIEETVVGTSVYCRCQELPPSEVVSMEPPDPPTQPVSFVAKFTAV
jgi:hypothetical protein